MWLCRKHLLLLLLVVAVVTAASTHLFDLIVFYDLCKSLTNVAKGENENHLDAHWTYTVHYILSLYPFSSLWASAVERFCHAPDAVRRHLNPLSRYRYNTTQHIDVATS
jgi:hypothetical protein